MKRKNDKLIDDLLEAYDFKIKQDGSSNLQLTDLNEITRDIIRRLLNKIHKSELETKLGYKTNDQKSRLVSNNYRNGAYSKTVKSSNGNITLEIPRDRNGEYEPKFVPKYTTTIVGLEQKILNLLQCGMSYDGVQQTLKEMYTINIDPHELSEITSKTFKFVED
jgi:transposase-like protein